MTYMGNDSRISSKRKKCKRLNWTCIQVRKKNSIEVAVEQEKKTTTLCLCVKRHLKCNWPRKHAHRTRIFLKKLHCGFQNRLAFIHSLEPVTLRNIDMKKIWLLSKDSPKEVDVATICVIWPITTILVVGDNTSNLWLHIERGHWNSLLKSITLWHIIACEILWWWTPKTCALAFCDELPPKLITTISKTCFVASFTLEHDFFTSPKLFINPFMTFSWTIT